MKEISLDNGLTLSKHEKKMLIELEKLKIKIKDVKEDVG